MIENNLKKKKIKMHQYCVRTQFVSLRGGSKVEVILKIVKVCVTWMTSFSTLKELGLKSSLNFDVFLHETCKHQFTKAIFQNN
jgi:hypothetical protein